MQSLNAYNLKFICLCINMQCRSRQRGDKSEQISMQCFTRCAFKQHINNYQAHFWTIKAVLMTFEAFVVRKSVRLAGQPFIRPPVLQSTISSSPTIRQNFTKLHRNDFCALHFKVVQRFPFHAEIWLPRQLI